MPDISIGVIEGQWSHHTYDGLKLTCMSPQIHFEEAIRPLENILPRLENKRYCVDIGANAGAFGLYALRKGFELSVFVEPMFVERLYENIYKNGFIKQSIVIPLACWSRTGDEISLSRTDGSPDVVYAGSEKREGSDVAYVAGSVYDTYKTMEFGNILELLPEVDVLKIDTEGSEFNFIGDTRSVKEPLSKVKCLIFEIHSFLKRASFYHPLGLTPPEESAPRIHRVSITAAEFTAFFESIGLKLLPELREFHTVDGVFNYSMSHVHPQFMRQLIYVRDDALVI